MESISSTFAEQKTLWHEKAACKMLMKVTPVADPIKLFFLRILIFAVEAEDLIHI